MNKKYQSLLIYSLYFIGLFPIVPNFLKSWPVILFGLISIIFVVKSRNKTVNNIGLMVSSILFVALTFSLTYTDNISAGLSLLATQLSLLLFPIYFMVFIFGKIDISKRTIFHVFFLFWISTFTFYLVFLVNTLFIDQLHLKSSFFRASIQAFPLIGQHPIYASVYGALALQFSYFYSEQFIDKIKLPWYIIINSFIVFFLFVLSSKTIIIFLFLFAFWIILKKLKLRLKGTLILICASILVVISVYKTPFIEGRFREVFANGTYHKVNINNSTSIRFAIWSTSVELIREAPWWGYGVGDVKDKLIEKYVLKSEILVKDSYNTHNQYFSYLLAIGIIGPLLLIVNLTYGIIIGIRHRNLLLVAISIFYTINFLTENLLERRSGVVLFSFFFNLLVYISTSIPLNKTR